MINPRADATDGVDQRRRTLSRRFPRVLRFQSLEVERTRKMRGRRGRRGPYIDFADAVHVDDCESYGLYKPGMRRRVYRDVAVS